MILGIDIGGTAVKMGLVTPQGEILRRHEAPVAYDGYKTPILDTVEREAIAFTQGAEDLQAIAVSATGQVDDRSGTVIGVNGAIPGYEGSPIRARLEARFGVPVRALNDANAAVLGECAYGRGRGYDDVLMITLGTGVGGGVVTGGRLLRGARGIAGELGHAPLDRTGRLCPCGRRGCLEQFASATALVRRAEEALAETGLNGRILFTRAAQGDPAVLRVLDAWIDDIAEGIGGLVHIFNPALVLIGGGVSAQEDLLIEPLRKKIRARVMPRFGEALIVEAAQLKNDAGLLGAVRFLLDELPELEKTV